MILIHHFLMFYCMNNPDLTKRELSFHLLYYIIQNHNEDQEESQFQHLDNLYYKPIITTIVWMRI